MWSVGDKPATVSGDIQLWERLDICVMGSGLCVAAGGPLSDANVETDASVSLP